MIADISITEKSFGPKVLMSGVKFSVDAKEKVGIVGRNGVGKSTLFGILADTDTDFTGGHEGFQYIIPKLKDFRIIVPDLPGFGESTIDESNWSLDDIARLANEFVAKLQLDQPYLIAHSMGGLVAASMLAQNPELYNKKTVFVSPAVEPVGIFDTRSFGAWLGSAQYFLGKTVPVFGPKLVKSRLLSKIATKLIMTADDRPTQHAIYEHHYKNLDFISSIKFYYKLHREIIKTGAIHYAEALQKFDSLIITGNSDNVTPLAGQKRFQKAIAARLYIISGVGHLLHYERPTEVAAAIQEFLNS